MKHIQQYQTIFLEYLAENSFEQEPKGLYEPIDYILNLGGKRMRPVSLLMSYAVFKDNVQAVDKAVVTKLEREFGNAAHKRMFISNALKNGSFFCVSVMLSRADQPDMDYLNPELSYIASYAIHRGKQIEQDIWSTVGMIQCFDITQEVLLRYQLILKDSNAETVI